MTTITFELAEPFRTSPFTAYLQDVQKEYGEKFPGWDRIEFYIQELTLLERTTTDKFDFKTWGCIVRLKVSRSQQAFYDHIKSSLEYLAGKFLIN